MILFGDRGIVAATTPCSVQNVTMSPRKNTASILDALRRFMVRVSPETHRALAIEAAEEGVSLNRLVSARLAR